LENHNVAPVDEQRPRDVSVDAVGVLHPSDRLRAVACAGDVNAR